MKDDGTGDELREYNGLLDTAIRQASKLAGGAVDKLRAQYPDATDDALVKKLEALFSRTVTTTGAATGVVAAVPGAGTVAALASGVGDGTFFLTASAAHVLAVASVYGIRVEEYERQRALLLMVLAEGGMAEGLGARFVTRYGRKRGILVLGRAAPFGLGVAIGGGGNFLMARGVIKATRKAFDSTPTD